MKKQTDATLNTLIEKACELYQKNENPTSYADFAAHHVAMTVAAEFNPDSADAAAFAAAVQYVSSLMEAAKYSGRLVKTKTQANDALRHYHALRTTSRGHSIPTPITTTLHFDTVFHSLETTPGNEARTAYDKTYPDEKSKQAYTAACAAYPHAYASAYDNYLHAAAIGARYSAGPTRQRIFRQTIRKGLNTKLGQEPLSPGLFMQILCNNVTTIIAVILLIAGLAALTLGICGLAIPAVAVFLSHLGIESTILTASGAVATTVGSSLLIGQFFAERKWQHDNEASRKAVKAMTSHNCP